MSTNNSNSSCVACSCSIVLLLICTVASASEHPSETAEIGIDQQTNNGMNAETSDIPIKQGSFPGGDVFVPLIAAPKEPQFFASYIKLDNQNTNNLALVGLGDTFGLYRWEDNGLGDGWQLSFFGAFFSQFNMDASSNDLLNTDYQVGFPFTYRQGSFSARLRLYHQSSHLGDELLLGNNPPPRINLSVEVVDALLSYEWRNWRSYGGLSYILRHDPEEFDPWGAQAGVEYRSPVNVLGANQFLGGLDIESFEEINWKAAVSLKIGLAYGRQLQGEKGIRFMLEVYDGPAPFGQFYIREITYYGLGIYFDI